MVNDEVTKYCHIYNIDYYLYTWDVVHPGTTTHYGMVKLIFTTAKNVVLITLLGNFTVLDFSGRSKFRFSPQRFISSVLSEKPRKYEGEAGEGTSSNSS